MDYIVQAIMSFIASACFGVIFNAPYRKLLYCGLVGSISWTIYYSLTTLASFDAVHASFASALVVGISAHLLAKSLRTPMIVFNVSGIIPLVPGGASYNAMRSLMENDFMMGVQYSARVFLIAGAIAMGLVFAEVMMQFVRRMMANKKEVLQK